MIEDTVLETKGTIKDWKKVRVKDIAESIQYGYTESSTKDEVGPKFLRITDIQNNSVEWDNVPYCKIDEENKKKYILKDGDLVFARTGATVGKSFLIKGQIPESVFASYLIRLRFNKGIVDKYIWYYFQSLDYWRQITDGQVGIGQPNVNGTKLGQLLIPLPTLTEQHSIVSKLEELLSELDKSIEDLKTAQHQLKMYRQSVLKWAFEGKLTNLKVNEGELPKGWLTSNLGKLKTFSLYGPRFSSKDYSYDGIAVLRTSDISENGKVDWENAPKLKLSEKEYEKYKLIKNDLLITRTGSIGTISVFNDDKRAIPGAFLIHYRLTEVANVWFIYYFLKSHIAQKHFKEYSFGVGRPNLNVPNIELLNIPLPCLEEQNYILEEIESRFTIADKVEETILNSLKKAEALRQSILKKAFNGRLT